MGLDIDIVWASVSTVLVVFATMAVGAVCSIFPRSPDPTEDISLLPRAFLAQISDLVNRITLPCLIWYSMGKSFSVDLLKEAWPLIILAWMLIGISQAIAYISRYMLNPPSYFRNEYTAMITMGNAGTYTD